jgi:hypothetical protein
MAHHHRMQIGDLILYSAMAAAVAFTVQYKRENTQWEKTRQFEYAEFGFQLTVVRTHCAKYKNRDISDQCYDNVFDVSERELYRKYGH